MAKMTNCLWNLLIALNSLKMDKVNPLKRITAWFRKIMARKFTKPVALVGAFVVILALGAIAGIIQASNSSRPVSQQSGINAEVPQSPQSVSTNSVNQKQTTNATPSNSPQQRSTTQNTTSDSGSTLDQYGCATNTPSYNQCVQNKRTSWCGTQVMTPSSTFNSATLQARTAYNTVMNEWEIMQYKPVHSPKSEYLADATSKFNAIYEPAYNSYFDEVKSLNSQGCTLQYPSHESPGQYW
jgi:hypothetical protein